MGIGPIEAPTARDGVRASAMGCRGRRPQLVGATAAVERDGGGRSCGGGGGG